MIRPKSEAIKMARKLQIEWQEDENTLKELYKREKDHQNRGRLQALWLVRTGRPMSEVAPIVDVHYRTIQEWIAWYRAGGLEEVLKHRRGGHGGAKSRLTKEQEEDLVTKSKTGEIYSIWNGVDWAEKEHQVSYTYWGMRSVFQRLDLTKKVPRPKSPKASAKDQETWKKGG
jgi:transposase